MSATAAKEIDVSRVRLNGTYLLLEQLPVKAFFTEKLHPVSGDWEHAVCVQLLRHWKEVGCVALYRKERVVDVTAEAYKDMAIEEAQKIIASLIQQGVFREEDGWLIPLRPILECATDHVVERGFPSFLVKTYYDVTISLR